MFNFSYIIRIKKSEDNVYRGYIPELRFISLGESEQEVIDGANEYVKSIYNNRKLFDNLEGGSSVYSTEVDSFFDTRYYYKIVNIEL